MIVWNQHSRAEIRQGFRRSRLTCATSSDEGKTWRNFRNIEAVQSLASVSHFPADPDLTPVVGDNEVGALPDDYANFHYPTVSVIGEEVFLSYLFNRYQLGNDAKGQPVVKATGAPRTRILPVAWFYGDKST